MISPAPCRVATDRHCFLLRGALTPDECSRTIDDAWSRRFLPMGRDYPADYRDNDRRLRDDPALAVALLERLRDWLPQTLERDGATWTLVGLNPRFRICRYHGGQHFTKHRDGAWSPEPGVRSWLTVMAYLDDRFVGGATRFYAAGGPTTDRLGSVQPESGTAIVFDHALWHDGEPVTHGTKHVLRTDVLYRRLDGRASGHDGYIWAVLPRRDGTIATGSRDRTIRLWRGGAEEAIWRGHDASVTALAEGEDGALWSGSRDRTVRRWWDGAAEVRHLAGGMVLALAPVSHGMAYADSSGTVTRLEPDGPRSWSAHAGWAWGLAAMGGERLVSGGEDGAVALWSPSGACERCLGLGAPVRAVAARGDRLVAGLATGDVVVLTSGLVELARWRAHDGPVTCVAIDSAERVASGGEDAVAKVWEEQRPTGTHTHTDFVRAVAFGAGGQLVSAGYDGILYGG